LNDPLKMVHRSTTDAVLDQMGFAKLLSDINVAMKPLQSKDLSETAIVEAIEEMKRTYEEKKENAYYFCIPLFHWLL